MFRTTRPGAHGGDDSSSDGAAPTAKVGLGGVEGAPRSRRPVRSRSLAGVQSDDPGLTLALAPARQPALSPSLLTRALARGPSVTFVLSRSTLVHSHRIFGRSPPQASGSRSVLCSRAEAATGTKAAKPSVVLVLS